MGQLCTIPKIFSLFFIVCCQCSRPDMFCKKVVLRNFGKLTGKHLCQSLLFNEVACLRPVTLFKKRLWHRYFLVNYVKFLRTSFLTEHLWWLLLCCQLTILTGKNYKKSSIQEFVKLYSWLLLIFVYTTNSLPNNNSVLQQC